MNNETKKFEWKTQYNPPPINAQQFTKPSLVIPNEAMSIREILVRYSRGLPIDQKIPIYDEENDLPDFRKLDLAEIQELREQYAEEINEIKKRHAETMKKQQGNDVKKVKEVESETTPDEKPE